MQPWLFLLVVPTVLAEGFTFPTSDEYEFIVGDLVNVTWNVVTARFSLYEVCDTAVVLESNSTNNYSYIWNATRANYRESGCVFELEPLGANGTPNPPNLTSVLFGVDKRYASDPAPTDWNFGGSNATATATSSASASTSTSAPTSTSTATSISVATATAAVTTTPSPHTSSLSSAQKVGIGVGVPLGVLTLCLAGFVVIWYRRRRVRRRRTTRDVDADPDAEKSKASASFPVHGHNRVSSGTETLVSELSAQNYDDDGGGSYRDSRAISELMGTARAEME